ncbi:MAG TPA: RluA family pseudouridine synthase [Spirochaetota bacterium]|nr:RluA family pseudouridine synthase [Spirochaetota bacterium]
MMDTIKRTTFTTVTGIMDPVRLDQYLARRFSYLSRSQWQQEIKSGKIEINGAPAHRPHHRVISGDTLLYSGREIAEPPVNTDFGILYEDENLIAVSKSGNIPTHPSGRFFNNTLSMVLQNHYGHPVYPLHRLDRETSGIILFAKNTDFASLMHTHIKNASKTYIAVVHGNMESSEIRITAPIGNDFTSPVRKKRGIEDSGESAITVVRRLFCFDTYTLVKALPETGRLHQIRVHLHHCGYPILGDKLYGLDDTFYLEFIERGLDEELLEKLTFPRSALHSRSYSFYHPLMKKTLHLKSPLPGDMKSFISARRS